MKLRIEVAVLLLASSIASANTTGTVYSDAKVGAARTAEQTKAAGGGPSSASTGSAAAAAARAALAAKAIKPAQTQAKPVSNSVRSEKSKAVDVVRQLLDKGMIERGNAPALAQQIVRDVALQSRVEKAIASNDSVEMDAIMLEVLNKKQMDPAGIDADYSAARESAQALSKAVSQSKGWTGSAKMSKDNVNIFMDAYVRACSTTFNELSSMKQAASEYTAKTGKAIDWKKIKELCG